MAAFTAIAALPPPQQIAKELAGGVPAELPKSPLLGILGVIMGAGMGNFTSPRTASKFAFCPCASQALRDSSSRAHSVVIAETLWSDGLRRLMRRIRNMKLLGRWSVTSFIKLVIDVPYYFLLVVLPLVFAIAFWLTLTPGHSGSVQIQIPGRFQLDPGTHPIAIS